MKSPGRWDTMTSVLFTSFSNLKPDFRRVCIVRNFHSCKILEFRLYNWWNFKRRAGGEFTRGNPEIVDALRPHLHLPRTPSALKNLDARAFLESFFKTLGMFG